MHISSKTHTHIHHLHTYYINNNQQQPLWNPNFDGSKMEKTKIDNKKTYFIAIYKQEQFIVKKKKIK